MFSNVCNERVQHVISHIMTLLCTQMRVTTPGTTLSGTAAATLPEAIRVEGALLCLLTVPDVTKEKKGEEEKMDLFSSRDRNGGKGTKKIGK